jgi:hypothetical protein
MMKRQAGAFFFSRRQECLLFLSHHTQPGAMAALVKLKQECRHTVFPLFDQTKEHFDIKHIDSKAVGLTCADTVTVLSYPTRHQEHPGNFWPKTIDLPLLWFFAQNPNFHYYWLMEYDVRFTGHWRDFFRHFERNTSDLLATTLFDYDFRPDWHHWNTLKNPVNIPLQERTRALFPIYRISRPALEALHKAYCNGWSGHYEVTIPTILKHHGFTLEDIGGDGAYVRSGNRNRFYRNSPQIGGLAPGTFTVAPNQISDDYPSNMLWHPIKG